MRFAIWDDENPSQQFQTNALATPVWSLMLLFSASGVSSCTFSSRMCLARRHLVMPELGLIIWTIYMLRYKQPRIPVIWINMELNHPQFGKRSKVWISQDCSRFVTLHFMGYGDCASENTVSSRQTDASLHQLAWVVFGCSQCSQQIVKSYGSDWENPRMMFMLLWIDLLCESR